MADKKQCPKCFTMIDSNDDICPCCGYEFESYDNEDAEQFAN